ncbi:MAG: Ribose-phosphate pyrophosphokinase [Chlamydiae bacterium]|nr:Ribose-phosphate pyrophosphokinase [Chlamydiota bacterium]
MGCGMTVKDNDYVILSGSSHPSLAKEIANHLGMDLGEVNLERFPDKEISVQILDSVRGKDVFVVQTIALEPNEYLMELLMMVDALRRASARNIIAVIPYFGYARQDRKDKPRVPISAKLVANLLEKAGVDRVLTMDLHAGQLQGFFDIPVDNLNSMPLLANAFKRLDLPDVVIVAPDAGSIKLARDYANLLGVDFAVIDKIRRCATEVEITTLIGEIEGKNVLLADDMCSTGGTLVSAAKACREKGALRIFCSLAHGLFVGNSVERVEDSPIEVLLMSNTIPVTDRLTGLTKYQIVSVGSHFAEAINCINSAGSIHSLYSYIGV